MADELHTLGRTPGVHGTGNGDQLDRKLAESDPGTWYGLVWRIVRTAMESNANMIRVSILLMLTCAVLLLIAHIGW
jgi:hypothetical protein